MGHVADGASRDAIMLRHETQWAAVWSLSPTPGLKCAYAIYYLLSLARFLHLQIRDSNSYPTGPVQQEKIIDEGSLAQSRLLQMVATVIVRIKSKAMIT